MLRKLAMSNSTLFEWRNLSYMGLLALILTAVLMYLYHKLFTVVYVNALAGILREIVVCFVLSVVILGMVSHVLGIG